MGKNPFEPPGSDKVRNTVPVRHMPLRDHFAFETAPKKSLSARQNLSAAVRSVPSLPVIDLSSENLLIPATRMHFEGQPVPSLGGIPLLNKLGQGGMGAVYYGIEPKDGREVAIKILPFTMAQKDPELIQRFLREASLGARVRSPHLVLTSEAREEHGLYYLVMEFVSGKSAGELSKHAPLTEHDALEICLAVTRGLCVAHEAGIIHRDIKPDNILIPRETGSGKMQLQAAKLADLGLARSEENGNSLTGSQTGMGTPGFMAPEQALDARKCGKSVDVFSMGATLYALLTRRKPFKGKAPMEIVMQTIEGSHEPIANLRPDLSPATMALIERCMEKHSQSRFRDAAELYKYLDLCLKTPVADRERQRELVTAIRSGIKEKQAKENKQESSPAPQDLTMDAQTIFRQKACASQLLQRTESPPTQRNSIAAMLLASFLGAGLTVGLLGSGSSTPVNVEEASALAAITANTEKKQQTILEAGRQIETLQVQQQNQIPIKTPEGAFADEYRQKLAGSLDRALEIADRHKIVAPILPISSVGMVEESQSSRIPLIVFSFLMSVAGMVYLAYSRGSKNMTFGICGALLIVYGWFVPWLSVSIVVGGMLLTIPLFMTSKRVV